MSKRGRARHPNTAPRTAPTALVSGVFTVRAGGTTIVPTAHFKRTQQYPPPNAQQPAHIDVEGISVPVQYGEGQFCTHHAALKKSTSQAERDENENEKHRSEKFSPKIQWLIRAFASDITIEAPAGWTFDDVNSPATVILRFKDSKSVILVSNSHNHAVLVDRDPLCREEYEGMSYRDTRARQYVRPVEFIHFSDPDRAISAFSDGVETMLKLPVEQLPPKSLGNVDWSSDKHLAVRSVLMAFAKIDGLKFGRDVLNKKIGDFIGEALDQRPEDFGGEENTEKIRSCRVGALDSIIRYSFSKASKAKAPDAFEQRGLPQQVCNLTSAYAWARSNPTASLG